MGMQSCSWPSQTRAGLARDATKATSAGLLAKAKEADVLLGRRGSVARSTGVHTDDARAPQDAGCRGLQANVLGICVDNEKKYALSKAWPMMQSFCCPRFFSAAFRHHGLPMQKRCRHRVGASLPLTA